MCAPGCAVVVLRVCLWAVPTAPLILQQCPASCLRLLPPPTHSPREWDGPRWIRLLARKTPISPRAPPLHPAASSPLFANSRQTGCTSGKQTTGTKLIKGLSDPHSPPLPAEEAGSGHAPARSRVPKACRPPRPREAGAPGPAAHQLRQLLPGPLLPPPARSGEGSAPPVRRRRTASPPEDPGERLRLRSERPRVPPAAQLQRTRPPVDGDREQRRCSETERRFSVPQI